MTMRRSVGIAAIAGAMAATAARPVLRQLLWMRFRSSLDALNAGDYRPLLAGYADDAVLRFHPSGQHRWAGEHRGKDAIERFLRDFVTARLHGAVRELHVLGPPWRMTVVVRFDDAASADDGRELYRNRVVMLLRVRWGRVVEHEDFFEDTQRVERLEAELRAIGREPEG